MFKKLQVDLLSQKAETGHLSQKAGCGICPLLGYRGGVGGVVVVKDPMSWFDDKIMLAMVDADQKVRPYEECLVQLVGQGIWGISR